MRSIFSDHIRKSIEIRESILDGLATEVESAALLIADSLRGDGKLITCGNGGSAADAQHIAAELLIRFRSGNERAPLPAISVSSDPCVLTAAGNDYGANHIFSRSIRGLATERDILLAITTSGNSPNIIEAFLAAQEKGAKVILLTGRTGGEIVRRFGEKLNAVIRIPADETAHIQEAHIMIGHILCAIIEKELFGF
jgi:D-sedoheptulose 7-phosphate isomerase